MMKKKIFVLVVWLLICGMQVYSAPPVFSKSEYAARRIRMMEQIPDGVAIILGATGTISDRQFFQNNDFFYFCGVDVPNAVLIIDGIRKESSLFFSLTEHEARGENLPLELVHSPDRKSVV